MFNSCRGRLAALTFLAAGLAGGAQAHITLEQKTAEAGGLYKAVFRVGHGCDGAPTQAITVDLPPGVADAHPMPKPGWAVHTQARPGAPTQISWRGGPLADAHYDEFVVRVKLPAAAGPMWFRVQQQCERGAMDWAEQPAAGTDTRGLRRPAALLEVRPAAATAHAH